MEPKSDIPKVQRKIPLEMQRLHGVCRDGMAGSSGNSVQERTRSFPSPKSHCRVRAQAEARREVSQLSLMDNWTRSRQQPVHLKLTERYFFYL